MKVRVPALQTAPYPHRHRITFEDVDDVDVIVRAEMGMSTRGIAGALGFSDGQVAYRIKKGNAVGARARFRNGESECFKIAYEMVRRKMGRRIQDELVHKQLSALERERAA